jgi:tetratricopeptide (TPR) repeat protein
MRIKSLFYLFAIIAVVGCGAFIIISSNTELKTSAGLSVADYGLNNNRYEWGLSACNWVLEDSPYNTDELKLKINLLKALERYGEAYSVQKTLLSFVGSGSLTPDEWEDAAWLYIKNGDYPGAISAYEKILSQYADVLKENPSDADTLAEAGSVLINLQRYSEAAGVYNSVLEDDPENAEAWIGLGDAYLYNSLLKSGKIENIYSVNGLKKPRSQEISTGAAASQLKAVAAYKKAVEIKPLLFPRVAAKMAGSFQSSVSSYSDIVENSPLSDLGSGNVSDIENMTGMDSLTGDEGLLGGLF